MSSLKTNTNRGDARERTKNLENITIMGAANKSLNDTNQNLKTNVATFKNNKLQSTNNHSNLLKITHGYFDLEPCCDLLKQKATSLEDGLQTQINANNRITIAQSSCNRQPLFDSNDCNTPNKNMRPNVPKNNFKYPMPLEKNSCCSQTRIQPKIEINSSKTHTKFLPIMSKIKTFNFNKTQSFDPVTYPNFNIVNKNNLVGYFNNDVYKIQSTCSSTTSSCSSTHSLHSGPSSGSIPTKTPCSSSNPYKNTNTTATTSTATTHVGHKLKYSNYNAKTNCDCADYDDYTLNTSKLNEPPPISLSNDDSFFSRKWGNKNC